MPGVEDLDRQIVRLLAADGRRSYTDLARDTGLSVSALHQRVTLLTYFKFVADAGETEVYVPKRHREIIAKIYGRAGRRLVLRETERVGDAA